MFFVWKIIKYIWEVFLVAKKEIKFRWKTFFAALKKFLLFSFCCCCQRAKTMVLLWFMLRLKLDLILGSVMYIYRVCHRFRVTNWDDNIRVKQAWAVAKNGSSPKPNHFVWTFSFFIGIFWLTNNFIQKIFWIEHLTVVCVSVWYHENHVMCVLFFCHLSLFVLKCF